MVQGTYLHAEALTRLDENHRLMNDTSKLDQEVDRSS